ncbi:MAG TPA: pseudouridine-5'-phosphate glycosidase [Candidatus Rubrimentiphilum sp.]|nr:pseudouridine-5'-phosphate glycosidase [Candidatus Rubrimentiphilum sp.]
MPEFFDLSGEVRDALARRSPIVALESTIISHGMPHPQNVDTARAVEQIVRKAGAIPATIAVLRGRVLVGLDDAQLERLANSNDVRKLSTADLPYAVSQRRDGSTTVAATMRCAHAAGIGIFATGGIGGVHRGAERSFDVSADLYELARTPVAVVCAGAKALLDLPKTLETLETLGVPVVGYRTNEFPAFWSRASSLVLSLRIDEADGIAEFLRAQRALGLQSGAVIANPIPAENEIPRDQMNGCIETAARAAEQACVTGKAVTPWLLERINALTSGRSLEANVALVKSNARLAAEIALSLAAR